MKVSHKSKVHRTQLSLKNSVLFWKLHSRFFEFINTFSAYDSTCIQTFTFQNSFKRTHAFTHSIQMHSCIQTSSIQIHSQCLQTFTVHSWTLQCHQDMSEKCPRLLIYVHIFIATIKQIPKDDSLTVSTNAVSMQYPNAILNTKMTLRQLVRPVGVVSPEHSTDDLSHEFQIIAPRQLVHPNMHKARSFPRSPAKNIGYFHKEPSGIRHLRNEGIHAVN